MLQDIRKSSQGTAAKIVIGLIVFTFALFGVESIVGGLGGEPEVAEVNGEGVPESQYQRAFEIKRRQLLSQMGDLADPDLIDEGVLGASVLDGLIEQEVLRQDAELKGLYVSDVAIDRYITDIPQLHENGVFSNERLKTLLRGAGLTLQGYKDSLRTEFAIAQPRSAMIASSFLLDDELQEIVALDRQKRTFGELKVLQSEYLESVVVNDEDVAAYYEENSDLFKKPASVDVSYIEIRKSDLSAGVEVSEEEIERLYESELEAFEVEEERDASHILLKITDARNEAQALEEINQIKAKLDQGDDFAEIAKSQSEDEGSAASGGSLGAAAKGVYVSEFEDALFALKEGEISQPVKTEFGYHIIKLDRVVSGDAPSLESMSETLKARLVDQKVDQLYADLAERLADISYASSDLAEPSEELELTIKQLAGVSEETQDELFSNVKLQRKLFHSDLLEDGLNSELIELESGHGVVFRVDHYHAEGQKSLDEVKEEILELRQQEKASEFAESVGQAFIVRVVAGEKPEAVAEDMGIVWETHELVERTDRQLESALLNKVFSIQQGAAIKGSMIGYLDDAGNYQVALLKDVVSGQMDELSEVEQTSVSRVIAEGNGGTDYRSYKSISQLQAEIEKI